MHDQRILREISSLITDFQLSVKSLNHLANSLERASHAVSNDDLGTELDRHFMNIEELNALAQASSPPQIGPYESKIRNSVAKLEEFLQKNIQQT